MPFLVAEEWHFFVCGGGDNNVEMCVLYEDVEDACVLYGIPIGIHLATINYWQATDLYVREVGKNTGIRHPLRLVTSH